MTVKDSEREHVTQNLWIHSMDGKQSRGYWTWKTKMVEDFCSRNQWKLLAQRMSWFMERDDCKDL